MEYLAVFIVILIFIGWIIGQSSKGLDKLRNYKYEQERLSE